MRIFVEDTEISEQGRLSRETGSIAFTYDNSNFMLKLSYQDCIEIMGLALKAEARARESLE